MSATPHRPQLVSAKECIQLLFPSESSRPGLRTFREWQAKGYIPVTKIGSRTYFDPDAVSAALERRFRVHPASEG